MEGGRLGISKEVNGQVLVISAVKPLSGCSWSLIDCFIININALSGRSDRYFPRENIGVFGSITLIQISTRLLQSQTFSNCTPNHVLFKRFRLHNIPDLTPHIDSLTSSAAIL